MPLQKTLCFAALLLIGAGLMAVALDPMVAPGADHRPGNCPVCTWASSLASAAVPLAMVWIEQATCWQVAREPAGVCHGASVCRPFSARAPPPLETV